MHNEFFINTHQVLFLSFSILPTTEVVNFEASKEETCEINTLNNEEKQKRMKGDKIKAI